MGQGKGGMPCSTRHLRLCMACTSQWLTHVVAPLTCAPDHSWLACCFHMLCFFTHVVFFHTCCGAPHLCPRPFMACMFFHTCCVFFTHVVVPLSCAPDHSWLACFFHICCVFFTHVVVPLTCAPDHSWLACFFHTCCVFTHMLCFFHTCCGAPHLCPRPFMACMYCSMCVR